MRESSNRRFGSMMVLAAVAIGLGGFSSMSGCAKKEKVIVRVDGSSTVFPITEAVAEEFQAHKKGSVNVTVGVSGTGGGFKKFCRGEIDISDASRPIKKKEMKLCAENGIEYIELPVAFDALTVLVNPKNDWVKEMTTADLKKIWEPAAQGKIKTWKQVRSEWPDRPLRLFAPGADSGTFDYFTKAIVGKSQASRGDYTASEDDNILVQGIVMDQNALGYFGYSYYEENRSRLKAVPIVYKGETSSPSRDTVENGTYQPLSRPIFIYVSAKSLTKPHVREFAEFYLKNGRKLVEEVKIVPLPEKAYKMAFEKLTKGWTGTVFGGKSKVGVKVMDIVGKPGEAS